MSSVGPPFTHDLFISYSHGTVSDGKPLLREWSREFAKALERELLFEHKALTVFLDGDHRADQGVDPMSALTAQLREQIQSAAILVVLMSPHYLASTWCRDERDWWFAQQAAQGRSADGRVAVVRILPTRPPWPAELSDERGSPLVGFELHAPIYGVQRPLGWTDLGDKDFRAKIIDVAGRVGEKLTRMRARAEQRARAEAEAQKLAQPMGQTLYLHGRADARATWDKTAEILLERGFAIMPSEPDPLDSEPLKLQAIREQRVQILAECDALLLLGTPDGRALDADLVVVGRGDRQSARARTHRLLPCGVLDTVGAPIATPVRRASARTMQADWIDGTNPGWAAEVSRWLAGKVPMGSAAPRVT